MSNISVSESGNYFYIMQGDSDADCWPQHKEAKSPEEEIIIRLCEKILSYKQQQQTILDLQKKRTKGEINDAYAMTIERQAEENRVLKVTNNKLKQKVESLTKTLKTQ